MGTKGYIRLTYSTLQDALLAIRPYGMLARFGSALRQINEAAAVPVVEGVASESLPAGHLAAFFVEGIFLPIIMVGALSMMLGSECFVDVVLALRHFRVC